MKKLFTIFLFTLPLILSAQEDSVVGGIYKYREPAPSKNKISSVVLFNGGTADLYQVQMTSNIIADRKKIPLHHAPKECLLIVKSGTLLLSMKDSSWSLGKGSVALIMPPENCWLQNASTQPCEFYVLSYTSKKSEDEQRAVNTGGSVVVEWDQIVFTSHDKGGIRRFLDRPTAMLEKFEMHATTLKEGLKSHDPHTHRAAEIILMLDGNTEMQVGNNFYKGNAGDMYYAPSNVSHAIRNDGKGDCVYFAFQFQ